MSGVLQVLSGPLKVYVWNIKAIDQERRSSTVVYVRAPRSVGERDIRVAGVAKMIDRAHQHKAMDSPM